jgi:hypothetical protein
MKWLVIEEPYKESVLVPFNTAYEYGLDKEDIQALKEGQTVFSKGTAYSIEEQDA